MKEPWDSSPIKAYADYSSSTAYLTKPGLIHLKSALPKREGARPLCGRELPHFQLEDQSPDDVFKSLRTRAAELLLDSNNDEGKEEVTVGHSTASLPTTYPCYHLSTNCGEMPYEASMTPGGPTKGREFAHVHTKYYPPPQDNNHNHQNLSASTRTVTMPNQGGGQGSIHVCLSLKDAATVLDCGWGERHLQAGEQIKKWAPDICVPRGLVLVYAPRTEKEIDTVLRILAASLAFAKSSSSAKK